MNLIFSEAVELDWCPELEDPCFACAVWKLEDGDKHFFASVVAKTQDELKNIMERMKKAETAEELSDDSDSIRLAPKYRPCDSPSLKGTQYMGHTPANTKTPKFDSYIERYATP